MPAAPLEMTVVDIGPTSVQLEWMFGDNGGAVEKGIHVTFVTLEQEMEVVVKIDIGPGQTSALIEGFMDNTPYRVRLQARNRIGERIYNYVYQTVFPVT